MKSLQMILKPEILLDCLKPLSLRKVMPWYWLMLLLRLRKFKCLMERNMSKWIPPCSASCLLPWMNAWSGPKCSCLTFCVNIRPKIRHRLKCSYSNYFRVIDKVIPRLSHINPSVVFGCIKLIIRYLDYLSSEDLIKNLIKKLAPSIVSVVSFTPE